MEHTHSSDIGVWWSCDIATFCIPITFSPFFIFSSFYYFDSDFWYIDMHPTLAGLYPFLLGSPARCAFLLYFMYIYCLGSPARSRLSAATVALTGVWSGFHTPGWIINSNCQSPRMSQLAWACLGLANLWCLIVWQDPLQVCFLQW